MFKDLHKFTTYCTFKVHKVSGCSAVGSAPVLGTGGRRFKSCHPDSPFF